VSSLLWFVLLALTLAMIGTGLGNPLRRLQFPCLAGLSAFFQVLMPIAALQLKPQDLSEVALLRLMAMSILCLACAWWGYHRPSTPPRIAAWRFDARRLTISVFVLAGVGMAFQYLLSQTAPEFDSATTNWTGIVTVYLFLSGASRFAFVFGLLLLVRTRDWKFLFAMLPQVAAYTIAVVYARRGPIGELALTVVLVLLFWRRRVPPFWVLLAGASVAAILSLNIGMLRSSIGRPLGERVAAFQKSAALAAITHEGMARSGAAVELSNAAHFMEARSISGHFDLGLHFWNRLVFAWVPAQFLGRSFKNALMFDEPDDATAMGFKKPNGTCETGIGEAYMSLWFFGAVLFFWLGSWMRKLWEGAGRGSVVCQCMLCVFTMQAVLTFSSQLWSLVNAFTQFAVFVGPLLYWSRNRPAATNARRTSLARSHSVAARHGISAPLPGPCSS
jgi:hypothetical protein